MSVDPWLGRDEHGEAEQARPDRMPPPHWRLDAVYATRLPHHPAVSPDGSTVAFVLSSGAESDIYLVEQIDRLDPPLLIAHRERRTPGCT